MSRLDGKLTAAGEVPLELEELLAALEAQPGAKAPDWRGAVACYLSASEGWRDASEVLGGAFAGELTEPGSGRNNEA